LGAATSLTPAGSDPEYKANFLMPTSTDEYLYLVWDYTAGSTPTNLLLDDYPGAAAAYSVRRLNSAYTGACMRVRRDSDNTEQDIGFDSNGDLDTSALATFVGSGNNGYVRYWYDQSTAGGTGSGNDAGQATATSQPQIYNGTAVITENGKPELLCNNSRFDLTSSITPSAYSAIHVSQQSARDSASFGRSTTFNYSALYQNSNTWFYHVTAGRTVNYVVPLDTQQLHWLNWSGTTVGIGVDGSTLTTGSLSASPEINTLLYAAGQTAGGWRGGVQEMVFWPNDEENAGNRTGIETNINTYFSIYT